MDYSQYKQLREEIEADYKKKKDALETLWSMQKHQDSSIIDQNHSGQKVSISVAIRRVVSGLNDSFGVDDVLQGLKDLNIKGIERLSVTNTLHRLWRRKELEVVEKGQGRRASVYRTIKNKETA